MHTIIKGHKGNEYRNVETKVVKKTKMKYSKKECKRQRMKGKGGKKIQKG
jgi:hypothetical protein